MRTRTEGLFPTRKSSASGRAVLIAAGATGEVKYTRHVHPSMAIEGWIGGKTQRLLMYDVSS